MASGVRPRVTWLIHRSATCALIIVPAFAKASAGRPAGDAWPLPFLAGRRSMGFGQSTRLLSPNWNRPLLSARNNSAPAPFKARHVFVKRLAIRFLVVDRCD